MRSILFLAVIALSLAACDSAAPDLSTAPTALAGAPGGDTDLGPALAEVRAATAKYHRVDRAIADGYGVGEFAISPCVSVPELGGMGHHYVNLDLRDEDGGQLDPTAPEVLLYEPTKNGRFRLIGVEYVVPFADEPREADGGTAPELFGQTFTESDGANGWALHVWTWKHNPSGMFADFNPTVSCEYAQAPGS